MRIDSTMRCNMCAVHVGWDAVKQDGKFHSGYGSFVKGLDHSLEMLCKRQKKVMRCTVAPIKIFQGALSSLPQVKNAWQCLQTRHLWQITTTSHSKSPKSGPLGSRLFEALWGCSCHQTNPTFSMSRFPRFGVSLSRFQFAHQKWNKKKTEAKHRGTFHPSCFQVQVSSVSFHLLHWFVTFLGFEVEEFDQSDQFLDHQLWLSSPSTSPPSSHSSPSSPADSSHVDASQSSRASFFVILMLLVESLYQ